MNTTAIRQPSTNPFDLVHIDAMVERQAFESLLGTFACQAITGKGNACTHQAVAKAWGQGPRRAAQILLCKTHANARFLVDADPSL